MWRSVLFLFCYAASSMSLAGEPLQFGVLNQRSVLRTAQLWNPILEYVSAKSGVPLTLRMGKTAQDTMTMAERGELDFIYSNLLFTPERDKLGYYPIARFNTPGIRGQIVTRADAPYRQLADLQGQQVAFPSPQGFAGYIVPMQALLQSGITVQPVFTGNQEASMARFQYGQVAAAGVNSNLMANYARREALVYRVLYSSPVYLDLPIMVKSSVPVARVSQVQQALLGMVNDSLGRQILQRVSAQLKSDLVLSFVAANSKDYDSYRQVYRSAQVQP